MNYIIETEKLGLREFTMEDLKVWHAILSDSETMKYYPKPFDEEKTKSWIERNLNLYKKYGLGLFAVIIKETGEFIGDCGITLQNIYRGGNLLPEIGFHIDKRFWRKGYGSEAAKACLKYVFENTKFDEVFCYQKSTNIPSRKTAEKMGMSLKSEFADKVNTITSVYSITRAELVKGKRKRERERG